MRLDISFPLFSPAFPNREFLSCVWSSALTLELWTYFLLILGCQNSMWSNNMPPISIV